MSFGTFDPAWAWLLAGALLALLELAVPGIFLVWLAAAAVLTAIVTFIFDPGLPVQALLFGLFSIGTVLGGAQVYRRSGSASEDPLLNDRVARLVGRVVTVETAISGGEGRVRVGDGIWAARGPDLPAGARVRITGADGACLTVLPTEALPPPQPQD